MVDKILHRTQDKVQAGKTALANTEDNSTETEMSSPVLFKNVDPELLVHITAGSSVLSMATSALAYGNDIGVIITAGLVGVAIPGAINLTSKYIMPRRRSLNKEFDGKADAEAVRNVRRIQKGLSKGQSATVPLKGLIDDTLMEGIAKRHDMELSLAVYPKKLKLKWTRIVEPGEQWDKTLSDIEAVYLLQQGAESTAKHERKEPWEMEIKRMEMA